MIAEVPLSGAEPVISLETSAEPMLLLSTDPVASSRTESMRDPVAPT